MFAFAVYNAARQELHVVRDRLGIKPLFYYWDGRQLAFASELKALKALPELRIETDFASVSHFLHLGYIPAPRTIYKNVFKLQPGHYLKATRQGLENVAFWSPAGNLTSRVLHDEKEAKKALEDLLLSAVQYQLISDVPLGVFLSGGIDSSTVAALASRLSNTRLNTFSIGFTEAKFNEAPYASAVAKHLGTQHHEFIVSAAEAKRLVEPMLDAYDEPYADSSAIPTMLVSQLARQHVTVGPVRRRRRRTVFRVWHVPVGRTAGQSLAESPPQARIEAAYHSGGAALPQSRFPVRVRRRVGPARAHFLPGTGLFRPERTAEPVGCRYDA
jgi:asparagine synthase (glutamine-hydrolysing)